MKWWNSVVAMEVRKILAYRSDFWITFIGYVLVQVLIARALWQSIFEATGKEVMEGFTLPMMTLYFLIVPIGNRILTGENIGFLSREIYDGSFNRYLIYPISFFQYKTLTYLTHSLFYALQLTLVYTVFLLVQGETSLLFSGNLFIGLTIYLIAAFAYAMLAMFVELISLWADNIWSLMVMVRFCIFFMGGAFIPVNFFPEAVQKVLVYTPFPYFVSFPVRTMMGLTTPQDLTRGSLMLILWSLFFMLSALMLWKRGQKNYTGVGI